jgi:ATP-dependent helicase HrpB
MPASFARADAPGDRPRRYLLAVRTPLPIDAVLPDLLAALAARPSAVLQAAPGAGKTTLVPLALLDAPWRPAAQRLVMLEPRRLAARAAARFMARTLGEEVGGTVGFRVRGETRVSARTRIEVVTEGVLTRMLQDDPALDGIAAVLFDEFHERSLNADAGLALCLQTQELLRPELRLLVMSATLDGARVAQLLGDAAHGPAPIITSEGHAYPVDVRYRERPLQGRLEDAVAGTIRDALRDETGDLLVFLPGAGEIRRVAERLDDLPPSIGVHQLHGTLPPADQDAALAPAPPGRRKVVLATSIAETSLTIEGVRVVVDGGLARVPRFSARTGMTRLETVRVPLASAEQRRGRAGRLGPGVCYRCWTVGEQAGLLPFARPELLEADLAPLALDLAAIGVRDPSELRWLDAPPTAAFAQGRALLVQLGALDAAGTLTPHGRAMAATGLHPRLAHLLLTAASLGLGALAADLAALLEERDLLRGRDGPPESDLRLRLEALRGGGRVQGYDVDRGGVQRVREQARVLRERVRDVSTHDRARVASDAPRASESQVADPDLLTSTTIGLLLAIAYPDRIARRRDGYAGRFLLANGRGAMLPSSDPLAREDWLVIAALDDAGSEGRVQLAAPADPAEFAPHSITTTVDEIVFDAKSRAVEARRRTLLGAIVLDEAPLRDPDPDAIVAALLQVIRRDGLRATLPWTDDIDALRARLAFAHALDADAWPAADDAALLATLEQWLAPALVGVRRLDALQKLDLRELLLGGLLDWRQRQQLDALAPERLTVPTGSQLRVDYADPSAPVLAVRMQEVFGLAETPRVGGGRVPVVLHLLSPAHRPMQVTRDLAAFWRGSYADVRKEMRGRYPKHYWPEDPLVAEPVRGVRRRG